MHEIERFGGKRIRENETSGIHVQFETDDGMDRWLSRMRKQYTTDTFSPYVARDTRTVVY